MLVSRGWKGGIDDNVSYTLILPGHEVLMVTRASGAKWSSHGFTNGDGEYMVKSSVPPCILWKVLECL